MSAGLGSAPYGPGMSSAAKTEKRSCPDGGACHHSCAADECFRVQACGPLPGYDQDWHPDDIAHYGGAEQRERLKRRSSRRPTSSDEVLYG